MIIDNLLSIDSRIFPSWQDADVFVTKNIYTFYEQMGNRILSEVVHSLFELEEVDKNEFLFSTTFSTESEVSLLNSIIDNYIELDLINLDPAKITASISEDELKRCIQAHQIMVYLISLCARRLHDKLHYDEVYKKEIKDFPTPLWIAQTVARKQSNYGTSNISKFGLYGLILRIHDKIGRIDNLLKFQKNSSIDNETIFDTLVDLVGYSILLNLWINNWFLLPMVDNYNWPEIETESFHFYDKI